MENKRQKTELADIFSDSAAEFLKNNPLCTVQRKAFEAITSCRTSKLGGHTRVCSDCQYTSHSYNSCRNRNCPKCQFLKQAQWVDRLAANLPAVRHFHIVFTIPDTLNSLFLLNQKVAYSLLFKAAGKTLLQSAWNSKYLGAQAGGVGILHTWGQNLSYHPHVHLIVPAGGLSDDETEWIPSARNFFVPVKVMSATFRGILFRLLRDAVERQLVRLPDPIADVEQLKNLCYQRSWVVYCEKPFSNSENLIKYLGRYTHRVAISNHRLVDYQGGKVRFTYKDYKAGGQQRVMELEAPEFIRRFMQHVLPSGFYKVRYFGFMAMRNAKTTLAECYRLIDKPSFLPTLQGLPAIEVLEMVTGRNPLECPKCKGLLREVLVKVRQSDG